MRRCVKNKFIPYHKRKNSFQQNFTVEKKEKKNEWIGLVVAIFGFLSVISPAVTAYIINDYSLLRQDLQYQLGEMKSLEVCAARANKAFLESKGKVDTFIERLNIQIKIVQHKNLSIVPAYEFLRKSIGAANIKDVLESIISAIGYIGDTNLKGELINFYGHLNKIHNAIELSGYLENHSDPIMLGPFYTSGNNNRIPHNEISEVDNLNGLTVDQNTQIDLSIFDINDINIDSLLHLKINTVHLEIEWSRITNDFYKWQGGVYQETVNIAERLNGWSYTPFTITPAYSCMGSL